MLSALPPALARMALFAALSATLAACGQRGPLYLPSVPPSSEHSRQAPATPTPLGTTPVDTSPQQP